MPDINSDKGLQQNIQDGHCQEDSEGEQQRFLQTVYEKIAEAENQVAQGCYLEDAETVLTNLKRKHEHQKNVG